MLILPGFLLSHCSNFAKNCSIDLTEFPVGRTQLLPSEIYAVRIEVQSWNDYPCSYSHRLLRAMLRLEMSSLCSFPTWMVANSPKYGVVIDTAMSDHIVLLFRLCLKAIVSESVGLANAPGEQEGEKKLISSDWRLECPVLVRVLMWLASHLSVLYGEDNGRLFAINILRQCILDYALKSSLFSGLQQATPLPELKDVNKEHEEPLESGKSHESGKENKGNNVEGGTLSKSMVSVSQVAAAVAALHERSILEGKIRTLQDLRPVSVSQRYSHILVYSLVISENFIAMALCITLCVCGNDGMYGLGVFCLALDICMPYLPFRFRVSLILHIGRNWQLSRISDLYLCFSYLIFHALVESCVNVVGDNVICTLS